MNGERRQQRGLMSRKFLYSLLYFPFSLPFLSLSSKTQFNQNNNRDSSTAMMKVHVACDWRGRTRGSQFPTIDRTYLEGVPEFMAHNIVQQRINTRRQEIEDARALVQDHIEFPLRSDVALCRVDSHKSLSVEWTPAQEEGNNDGHCVRKSENTVVY